ncbi:hypothetical protein QCA50_013960 [Cerrena zonata]|uniref:Uncharacterized protein n=1 Tax=Cerrena zonata TaxID=2478898 RepID=A0AAW0FS66_9APHY
MSQPGVFVPPPHPMQPYVMPPQVNQYNPQFQYQFHQLQQLQLQQQQLQQQQQQQQQQQKQKHIVPGNPPLPYQPPVSGQLPEQQIYNQFPQPIQHSQFQGQKMPMNLDGVNLQQFQQQQPQQFQQQYLIQQQQFQQQHQPHVQQQSHHQAHKSLLAQENPNMGIKNHESYNTIEHPDQQNASSENPQPLPLNQASPINRGSPLNQTNYPSPIPNESNNAYPLRNNQPLTTPITTSFPLAPIKKPSFPIRSTSAKNEKTPPPIKHEHQPPQLNPTLPHINLPSSDKSSTLNQNAYTMGDPEDINNVFYVPNEPILNISTRNLAPSYDSNDPNLDLSVPSSKGIKVTHTRQLTEYTYFGPTSCASYFGAEEQSPTDSDSVKSESVETEDSSESKTIGVFLSLAKPGKDHSIGRKSLL